MTNAADFWARQMRDPAYREAAEDEDAYLALKRRLVKARSASGLTQDQVAEHMEVGQSTVSQFENSADDHYYSTLQRYARAVGQRLDARIVSVSNVSWDADPHNVVVVSRRLMNVKVSVPRQGGLLRAGTEPSPLEVEHRLVSRFTDSPEESLAS